MIWVTLLRLALVLTLVSLAVMVLSSVFKPIFWGVILAILVSPLQKKLLGRFPYHANSIVFMLVLGAVIAIGGPVVWGLSEVQSEIAVAYGRFLVPLGKDPLHIPDQLEIVPWLDPWLHERLADLPRSAESLLTEFKGVIPVIGRGIGHLLRELTSQTFQLILTLISAFFLLRDGTRALQSSRQNLVVLIGPELDQYLKLIASTVYAVSFGLLGSAAAQGAVATVGYWLMGVETPLLLGLLSALASLIPIFGASLVWGPIALVMIFHDEITMACLLAAWGVLIVHPTDNLLRPVLISHLMHYPLSLVMLGVVGGVLSFGFVGAFLGPTILAILMKLWLEWSSSIRKS